MKHLVFVGAGHAHLYALSRVRDFRAAGARVTLIAPGRFWYSGMGPGMAAGTYEPSDDTVDVEHLVTQGGGEFVRGTVVRIEPARRALQLRHGRVINYDLLSLNVGSEVPVEEIAGAEENGVPVKPIKNLLTLRTSLTSKEHARRVVVIGGGAAGSEVCANLWHLLDGLDRAPELTLITSEGRLFPQAAPRASEILESYLQKLGIAIERNRRARRLDATEVLLDDDRRIPCDAGVVAIGIRPPRLLRESGLSCAGDGSFKVNSYLQSVSDPAIFGAGDCICFSEECLPRIGVYAVRQGPVLHCNLLATLRGSVLEPFSPQRRYLLILNLGDGTGLLTYGRLALRGRWAFWLKDWLDRRFVNKFRSRRN